MLWTVRDLASPDDDNTFEIELGQSPKIGELLTLIETIYEVVEVNVEDGVIAVERRGEADQPGIR